MSVLERKALDLLETYSGANNYIMRLRQKQIDNKKFYPTRAQAEYIVNYINTVPKVAKKWVDLDEYFSKKIWLQCPNLASKWSTMLNMNVRFVKSNHTKCCTMRTFDEHVPSVRMIDEKLGRQEDEQCRGGRPTKAAASFQQFAIYLFIGIKQLVEMLNSDSAEPLGGTIELGHHISREREEWDEDEDDPPLHHANCSKDISFTRARSLN